MLLEVVVRRSKWLNGKVLQEEGDLLSKGADPCSSMGESYLLRDDGLMCCLGFACLAAGVPRKKIHMVEMPSLVGVSNAKVNAKLSCLRSEDGKDLDITRQLAKVNDNGILTQSERETKIVALGKKIGISFKFVD